MIEISFIPFSDLATERLTLRQLSIEDENEIFALRSDDEVNKFLDRPKANSIEDARQFINKINDNIAKAQAILWAITWKDNFKLMGTICLWKISKEDARAEIGYELIPYWQGKGIMQEAMTKIIEYGFEQIKLQSITAELSPCNVRSVRLLEKNNFIKMPNSRDKKENTDSVIYMLHSKR